MHVLALFVALSAGLVLAPIAQAQMKEVTSQEGHFSVLMPGTPRSLTENIPLDRGVITVRSLMSESGKAIYGVSYGDYPNDYVKSQGKQILTDTRNGLARGMTVLWEKENSIDGYPGIAFRAKDNDTGYVMEVQAYLIGNRVFRLITVSALSQPDWPYRQEFLTSFKFKK